MAGLDFADRNTLPTAGPVLDDLAPAPHEDHAMRSEDTVSDCGSCPVRRFAFYGDDAIATPSQLQASRVEERSFLRGSIIWETGAPVERFAQLRSGWVMRFKLLPDGSRQIISFALPGDSLSFAALFSRAHQCSLQAITDCSVCFFPPEDALAWLQRAPAYPRLVQLLIEERQMLTDRVVDFGQRDASQRLARFVLELDTRLRARSPCANGTIALPLTQNLIGDVIGVTHVHVSRMMREFKDAGILLRSDRGRLEFSRPDLLRFAGMADD